MSTEFHVRPTHLEIEFYGHVTVEQTGYLRTQSHVRFATRVVLNYEQTESFESLVWVLLEAANIVDDFELTSVVVLPRNADPTARRVFGHAFGDGRLVSSASEAARVLGELRVRPAHFRGP